MAARQSYAEVWTYTDPVTENLKPAKQTEVFVYKAGTTSFATIYEAREGGSPASNPFISKENGLVQFWVEKGDYDIKFHDTIIPARFGDYVVGFQSSPVNVEIDIGELASTGDISWAQEVGGAWVASLKPGVVGLSELENAAFIPSSLLTSGTQQQLAASGDIKMSAISAAPTGWLLCNGASKLRTEYATLFSAIGTAFGSVDGTHFTLPNLMGRVPVGAGAGASLTSRTLGSLAGAETHTLAWAEMPQHYHGAGSLRTLINVQEAFQIFSNNSGQTFGASGFKAIPNWGNESNVVVNSTEWSTPGGASHNNMQPYQVVNFFIKT